MLKRLLTLFLCLTLLIVSFPMMEESAFAASPYYIEVDITNQIVTVFESGNTSESGIVRQMICSTGAPSTPTPRGTYYLPEKKYSADRTEWKRVNGAWAQWCTRITGSILFHSLPVDSKYAEPSAATVAALGTQASHGCIRLRTNDAKWIALNCPVGTKTKIFKSGNRDNELRALLLSGSFYRGNETYEHFLGLDTALKLGSTGERVATLQGRLNLLGYAAGTVNGQFGESTRNAVLAFQKMCGVKQNGYVTDKLWNLIFAADAPHAPITQGSSGQRVEEIQKALVTLKFYSDKISGVYDAATIQAVKDFQAANGMTVDGNASDSVRKAILTKAQEIADRFGNTAYDAVITTGTRTLAKVKVSSSLNLRKSASASSKSLGRLKNGTVVTVLQKGSTWSQVQSGDLVGYCKNSYLVFRTETFNQLEYQPVNPNASPSPSPSPSASPTATIDPSASATPAPVPSEQTLSLGSIGTAVINLQRALKELKLYSGELSGLYDAATAKAVQTFQSSTGMNADGEATPAVQAAIFAKADEVKKQFGDKDYELNMSTTSTTLAKVKVSSSLNLRKSASSSSKSLGRLKNGTIVAVLEKGATWSRVQHDDVIGYCKNSYLVFRTTTNSILGYKPAPTPAPTATPSPSPSPTPTPDPNATPTPAPVPSEQTLSLGSIGTAVINLQRALKELKLYNGELSGLYDAATAKAVKTFQSASGMTADGEATSAVQKAIFAKADEIKKQFGDSDYEANVNITAITKAKVRVSSSLNLRKSASASSKSLGRLKNGTVVDVLEKGSSWSKVQHGDLIGYCKNSYLQFGTITNTELTYKPVATATPAPSQKPSASPSVAPSTSPSATAGATAGATPTAAATPTAEATTRPEHLYAVIKSNGVKLYKDQALTSVYSIVGKGEFFEVTDMGGDTLTVKVGTGVAYLDCDDATVQSTKPSAQATPTVAPTPTATATSKPERLYAVIKSNGVKLYKDQDLVSVYSIVGEGEFFEIADMDSDVLAIKVGTGVAYVDRSDASVQSTKPAAQTPSTEDKATEKPAAETTSTVTDPVENGTSTETTPKSAETTSESTETGSNSSEPAAQSAETTAQSAEITDPIPEETAA